MSCPYPLMVFVPNQFQQPVSVHFFILLVIRSMGVPKKMLGVFVIPFLPQENIWRSIHTVAPINTAPTQRTPTMITPAKTQSTMFSISLIPFLPAPLSPSRTKVHAIRQSSIRTPLHDTSSPSPPAAPRHALPAPLDGLR